MTMQSIKTTRYLNTNSLYAHFLENILTKILFNKSAVYIYLNIY